jgi:DNA-binding transcriptional LysR family regulator
MTKLTRNTPGNTLGNTPGNTPDTTPHKAPDSPAALNFRTFDLNLLRIFDEIMAERSLTRAAHNLALTQPAVSNALRRLRDALGDELLQRQGQSMSPTAHALVIWPEVRAALDQLQHSLAPRRFDLATANDTFVIAMADATAGELIPVLADTLARTAPGVSLHVAPLTTRDPRALLDDGAIDLAVGYFPAVMADLTAQAQSGKVPNFKQARLYDAEYLCVMRGDHPLARKPLTLDSYCAARHLLVSFSGQAYGFVDEALSALGRERRVAMTVNQFFTAARVVARSDLLTVLPRHFFEDIASADGLIACELPLAVPTVHVESLWHRRTDPLAGHRWLRQVMADAAAQVFQQTGTHQNE